MAGGALELRLLPGRPAGKPATKGETAPFAADAAAEEIARILALAEGGRATLEEPGRSGPEERRLTGADIAVLVRTRAQGRRVADALRARNVRSVEVGDASVFDSREAEQMERLLWSLVEPGREARVRGALSGDLFGLDTRGLRELEEDEEAWSRWSDRLRGWRSAWEAEGIGPFLRRVVEAEGGAARLLRYRDGARRLTNVRHLTELLQEAEAERRLAPPALAVWFSRRRGEEGTRDEERQLRLESDEELVRVVTVHGAKGLEFPIVFLPFAWDARDPSRGGSKHAAYHGGEAEGYPEVLHLQPDEAAWTAARREELSEDLRLLYVALTRAKYRCVVTWGQVRGAERAPLAWLLHRGESAPEPTPRSFAARGGVSGAVPEGVVDAAIDAVESRFRGLGGAEFHADVRAFAAPCPESVSMRVLAPDDAERTTVLAVRPPAPLAPRTLDRPLPRTRQLTSFSALTAAAGAAAGTGGARVVPPDVDRPDHDQHEGRGTGGRAVGGGRGGWGPERVHLSARSRGGKLPAPHLRAAGRAVGTRSTTSTASAARSSSGSAFPTSGGEWPGTWWNGRGRCASRRRAGRRRTRRPGWRRKRRPGSDSPIPSRALVELEFAFPVAGLDRGRLAARLEKQGYPSPFPSAPDGRPDERPASPIDGFLRGFVDLVVEHGGRWYVIDYKSNWLGSSPGNYSREAVEAAMRSSAYPLQYLLYLVALHRHLGLRLPRYDYERNVGGVFYLFVRGMDPAAGMERGVWFDRPDASLIHELDRLFRGGPP